MSEALVKSSNLILMKFASCFWNKTFVQLVELLNKLCFLFSANSIGILFGNVVKDGEIIVMEHSVGKALFSD